MTTWWRSGGWDNELTAVEVEKFTEKCVWIKGRRTNRLSSWRNFFPSYSEARQHVIDGAQRQYNYAKANLSAAEIALAAANKIPESQPVESSRGRVA